MLGEVQQMIAIYNRGNTRSNGTFIERVNKAVLKVNVCQNLSDLQNCKIAIAHASDEDWKQLITEYSPSDCVRVRVTIGGNFADKPPPTDENSVYTFHLVTRAGDLEIEEWTEILSGLSNPEFIKQLVEGKNPSGLRRFFVYEVQEHLSALTLLCEGYLAVHAEDTDCQKDISHALELMEWTKFKSSKKGQELIRQDLSEKMSVVRQPQWWLNVCGQESFCNDVKEEWKDTAGAEMPTALNDLLEAIRKGESVEPPKIVADAYCTLVKKKW